MLSIKTCVACVALFAVSAVHASPVVPVVSRPQLPPGTWSPPGFSPPTEIFVPPASPEERVSWIARGEMEDAIDDLNAAIDAAQGDSSLSVSQAKKAIKTAGKTAKSRIKAAKKQGLQDLKEMDASEYYADQISDYAKECTTEAKDLTAAGVQSL